MTTLRNSVQLVGNLGKDVDLKTFDSGSQLATFTLATNEYYKDASGNGTKTTQWHNISAWGKLGTSMADNLGKGNQIVLHGKITYRNYTAKDGTVKYITEIIASDYMKVMSETVSEKAKETEETLPF
jgi:single-strand DNA-binding protein